MGRRCPLACRVGVERRLPRLVRFIVISTAALRFVFRRKACCRAGGDLDAPTSSDQLVGSGWAAEHWRSGLPQYWRGGALCRQGRRQGWKIHGAPSSGGERLLGRAGALPERTRCPNRSPVSRGTRPSAAACGSPGRWAFPAAIEDEAAGSAPSSSPG